MAVDGVLARVSELDSMISQLSGASPPASAAAASSFQRVLASRTAPYTPPTAPAPAPALPPAPPAAPAVPADTTRYGFVRRTDGSPGDVPFYQRLGGSGLGGVVFDSTDPGLESGLATAQQAGEKTGLWVPAGLDTGDPEAYASYAASLAQKYSPSVLVL